MTRLDSVRSLDWVSASRYNTGHGDSHSTLSSRLPPSPASASPLRRISSYSPPHCLHTQSPRVSSVTSYPVVTPSAAATSFAGPRPTPVPLIPHANYSSYCTAGQAIASSQGLVTFSANVPMSRSVPEPPPLSPASLLYCRHRWPQRRQLEASRAAQGQTLHRQRQRPQSSELWGCFSYQYPTCYSFRLDLRETTWA